MGLLLSLWFEFDVSQALKRDGHVGQVDIDGITAPAFIVSCYDRGSNAYGGSVSNRLNRPECGSTSRQSL